MKKIKRILIAFIAFLGSMSSVNAASSMSTSASSIYVGSPVSLSVTVSGVAAWEIHIGVSGAASASNCGSLNFADSDANAQNTTKTYTVSCTPTMTGTINFSLSGNTTDAAGNTVNISGSRSVSVVNRPVNNTTTPTTPKNNTTTNNGTVTPKSSVNYLKSLEVESKVLSPAFDKETSDYTVTLPSGTSSINIKAEVQDSKSSVNGTGTFQVSEGVNNFSVVVTAENGSKRTYNIKATVEEKDPIVVKIDGKEYTVVRKREHLIDASSFYSETTVKINGEEIPAYHGEITGYTLVGLKNSEGIINLFVYDEDKNTYKLYQELNFAKIVFYATDASDIPAGYYKDKITINGIEVTCYRVSKDDEFVLLYGVNIENNHEGFYTFDTVENTLQRYNENIFDGVNDEIFILKSILGIFVGITIIVVVAAAIQGTINKSGTKKVSKKTKQTKEDKLKNKEEKIQRKKERKETKKKNKEMNRQNKKGIKKIDDTQVIDVNDINIKK